MKTCSHCKETFDTNHFYYDKKIVDGLRSWCKTCCSKSSKKYNQTFKTERQAKRKKYKEKYYSIPENLEKKKQHERDKYKNDPTFRENQLRSAKEWRQANKRNIKNKYLIEQYGITIDDFERMANAQNQLCAICKLNPGKKGLAVDHCHKTNKVRGLLCGKCNTAIGLLQENEEIFLEAVKYLKKHYRP